MALRTITLLLASTAAALTGCASVAVSNDAITTHTATALHLEPSAFTISNRKDSGVQTTYDAVTTSGQKYSCYVTGGVTLVGPQVSDAICSAVGKQTVTATAAPATNCNALLKAAGKCS